MKAEIVVKIRALAEQDKVLELADDFNDLVTEFYRLQEEEEHQWEVEKLERIEAGEKPESIEKPVFEFLEEVKALSTLFHEKRKAEVREKKEIEKKNLEKKQTYLAALKDLIQNEENIGRAIARFRDIQEGWKEIGPIPRDKRQDLQREFSNLVDSFQYNINIYKEIKDHDLNRNLKMKQEIMEKLKALLELDRIKEVEKSLHALQDEWNSIGGTHQADWEQIKGEYWETVNAVYDKIRDFYKDRKEQLAANIESKKVLIEKAREIASHELDSHKAWKKWTDSLIELQNEWKKIGFGPKEENEAVWQEFRAVCNDFFDRKHQFYEKRGEEFGDIKEQKEKLIEEAKELSESTDWKETTKKIIALQKKWKDVGSAGPKYENRLWKRFREPIDKFFTTKDYHFKNKEASEAENLKKKKDLIAKIEAYKPNKDAHKSLDELKKFTEEFTAIGRVPIKEKDDVQKHFKAAMDKQYEGIDLSAEEKDKVLFEARLNGIFTGNNTDRLIEQERIQIRKQIDRCNKELNQYETNLAFFSNADESNPLFKNVMESIRGVNEKIETLKGRLRMLREAEQQAMKEVSVSDEEQGN